MSEPIRITIPILPKAQKRDRIGSRGGKGFSYKDKVQKLEEDKLLSLLMAYKPPVPFSEAIYLEIRVYLPIPQSKPRKWRDMAFSGELKPITKPDSDNYAKQIMDVMNGVYFDDDRQVTDLIVSKRYVNINASFPCWAITVKEII